MPPPNYAAALVAFSDDQVREIREEYRNGKPGTAIARERGVRKQTIYKILQSKTYRWVED